MGLCIIVTRVPLNTEINKKILCYRVCFAQSLVSEKLSFFYFVYNLVKNHYRKLPLRVKLC